MARDVQGSNIYTMKAGVIDKNPISSFWCNNNMNDYVRKQLFYRLVRRSFIRRLRAQGPILFLCCVLGQETHLSKGLFPPRITKLSADKFSVKRLATEERGGGGVNIVTHGGWYSQWRKLRQFRPLAQNNLICKTGIWLILVKSNCCVFIALGADTSQMDSLRGSLVWHIHHPEWCVSFNFTLFSSSAL